MSPQPFYGECEACPEPRHKLIAVRHTDGTWSRVNVCMEHGVAAYEKNEDRVLGKKRSPDDPRPPMRDDAATRVLAKELCNPDRTGWKEYPPQPDMPKLAGPKGPKP